ncbi:2'-5' RNA ligase family protein [Frigoribacterium sp. ACAM 257]|uniref:2'-5' RNA ligase family protein n=1 Tax=Frigoribacterium sp. ACAM 257 TaxID=2508998 RepID=UPI0011B9AC4A|nr:2'-5' RNA ligase family protein [Frigoribacterium sp. ACAM 257]TWX40124.1 2'-5' RNA ligase family protein [Frigoribacterium sp. ACAM 257]
MHSIELLLDGPADARIRAQWAALSDAGLPSQADHASSSNAPHVTLLARRSIDGRTDQALAALLDRLLPLPIELGAPLVFGRGRGHVLVRSVVATRALLELHAEVHAIVGGDDDVPHSSPGLWVPHVTLASRLDAESVGQALTAVEAFEDEEARGAPEDAGAKATGTVTVTGLVAGRRWDPGARTIVVLGR